MYLPVRSWWRSLMWTTTGPTSRSECSTPACLRTSPAARRWSQWGQLTWTKGKMEPCSTACWGLIQVSASQNSDSIRSSCCDGWAGILSVFLDAFSLDPNTGLVRSRRLLQSSERFNLTVVATDQGRPPLWGTADLIITVIDVNDNRPVFIRPANGTIIHISEVATHTSFSFHSGFKWVWMPGQMSVKVDNQHFQIKCHDFQLSSVLLRKHAA